MDEGCLNLAYLGRVNIEVRSRTFGGVEKNSGYEEGKKLLIYRKLTLMVCYH